MKKLVTTKELCEKLSVSLRTLARFRSEGLPFIKMAYRTVRYDLDAVMDWLNTRNEERKEYKNEYNRK
ncbi:helix-turn-helix domain-containing protein [Acinetobacter sp. CUI P1]|nr:helix-turn-helix domain-containing protein [Acinetobacter sp. CUI P1]